MTYDDAYAIGYDSFAYGLAQRFVHLDWSAANRAAWSRGYQEAARVMEFGSRVIRRCDQDYRDARDNAQAAIAEAEKRFGVKALDAPTSPDACRIGSPCHHSVFAGAYWLGSQDRTDGRGERTVGEILEQVEKWAGEAGRGFDWEANRDSILNGYADGFAGDDWRLQRVNAACHPMPADTAAERDAGAAVSRYIGQDADGMAVYLTTTI